MVTRVQMFLRWLRHTPTCRPSNPVKHRVAVISYPGMISCLFHILGMRHLLVTTRQWRRVGVCFTLSIHPWICSASSQRCAKTGRITSYRSKRSPVTVVFASGVLMHLRSLPQTRVQVPRGAASNFPTSSVRILVLWLCVATRLTCSSPPWSISTLITSPYRSCTLLLHT